MAFDVKKQEASLVVIGSFNPTIFNPDWLLRHELISQVEMDDVDIEIIHRDVAKFSLSWLSIEVVHNRFSARTNDQSYFLPLRDLVVSIFSILNQTPVVQIGMNMTFDFSFQDEALWHKIGDTLAPKDIWEKVLPKRVGLTSLKVKSPRVDDLEGNINIAVETLRSEDIKFGIRFSVNNHIEIDDDKTIEDLLMNHWEESLQQADKLSEMIIEEAIL